MNGTIKNYPAAAIFLIYPLDDSMALKTSVRKKSGNKPLEEQRPSTELGTFSQPLFVEIVVPMSGLTGSLKNEEQKQTVSSPDSDNDSGAWRCTRDGL